MFILFKLLFVSLQVFYHQIFAGQFVVIWEVVNDLMVGKADTWVARGVPDFGLKRLRTVQTVAQ
jgi:hypothetical protein